MSLENHLPANEQVTHPEQKDRVSATFPLQLPKLSPRKYRLLAELVVRPLRREQADAIIPASNGPHYVGCLRGYGLKIDCKHLAFKDRDGNICRPGVYRLLPESLPLALALLSSPTQGDKE